MDIVERLREEAEQCDPGPYGDTPRELKAAADKIERLRAALERILELDPDFGEPYVAACEAQRIAREALKDD